MKLRRIIPEDKIIVVDRMKSCLKEQDYSLHISQNERLLIFAKQDIMALR